MLKSEVLICEVIKMYFKYNKTMTYAEIVHVDNVMYIVKNKFLNLNIKA